nr:zinc-binding dehydrogenase [Actinopolymorpha cephalotaxi]
MSARIAAHLGARKVIGVDLVPERLALARKYGIETVDAGLGNVGDAVRDLTDGRGADTVIDAVGMEAHGAPLGKAAHQLVGMLPKPLAAKMTERGGVDRLTALHGAIDAVRRGGTISVSGVYGGMVDPMPMMTMFDKQLTIRMGQANVKRWVDDLLPLVAGDDDPLGVEDLATHRLPLGEAPRAYEMFQRKDDGAVKVLLTP